MAFKLTPVPGERHRGLSRWKLIKRDPRKKLAVYVSYRGGAEAWWELTARGVTIRVPGHRPIHEVLDTFTGTI